uniref:ornithine decarboxylase n=1 Tax=Sphaeramia orbicularis TaxID=375764 RepID=A0A673A2E8_9TELE
RRFPKESRRGKLGVMPFCVANLDSLIQQHNRWIINLPRVKPFYAVKCNNTPAVIKTLCTLGTGFDCASKGEIEQALSLGAAPEKIIFAHTAKIQSHIKYAFTHGVEMMTFDSEEELLKISNCHTRAKLVLRIAVDDSTSLERLSLKFGANEQTVEKLLKRGRELGLEIIGVSFHVGSGCTDSSVYKQAIEDARHVFDTNSLGFHMRLLDIGGGFPGDEDFQLSFEEISEVINKSLDKFFPADSGVEIIAEPGRYYVCRAFTLAVKIFAKKAVMYDPKNPDRMMMYYINDGTYGCFSVTKTDKAHPKFLISSENNTAEFISEQRYLSVIWGPTCDSKDKIVDNYWMPEFNVGEWLLFDNMGAYTVIGSSGFNGFEGCHIYPLMTTEKWQKLNFLTTLVVVRLD